MKQINEKKEFISLNSVLDEFALEQLEERLETDPLVVGGLLDISKSDDVLTNVTSQGCEFSLCIGNGLS